MFPLFRNVWQIEKISGPWEDAIISLFLVLFGGLMSGLTLGLMSLDLVELEVLQRSGSPREQKQASSVLPVVRKQHQLLVTLVLCNAIAMEALPVLLDNMFSTFVAVILSVTFVLAFGEIIPQAICSRNGLAIGAYLGWLVRILMFICFPVAYPVGKLLDFLLGRNQSELFRRCQLKAFVSIHGQEEGKGGELSQNETNIIIGALDLSLKTVKEAMTPIDSTFSLDINSKLDWGTLNSILSTGHSRIPVYSGNKENLFGIILVKSLLTLPPEANTPISTVYIRELPRVPADTPLYDVLNEFQKGKSHMAAVVNRNAGIKHALPDTTSIDEAEYGKVHIEKKNIKAGSEDVKSNVAYTKTIAECKSDINHYEHKVTIENQDSEGASDWHRKDASDQAKYRSTKWHSGGQGDEVIGIITLEDVFEELIQGEIVDETDRYINVHKRIKVAVGSEAPVFSFPHNEELHSEFGSSTMTKSFMKVPDTSSIMDTVDQVRRPLLDENLA